MTKVTKISVDIKFWTPWVFCPCQSQSTCIKWKFCIKQRCKWSLWDLQHKFGVAQDFGYHQSFVCNGLSLANIHIINSWKFLYNAEMKMILSSFLQKWLLWEMLSATTKLLSLRGYLSLHWDRYTYMYETTGDLPFLLIAVNEWDIVIFILWKYFEVTKILGCNEVYT